MEIDIKIRAISHEDLVDLFSAALYGSMEFVGRLLPEYNELEGEGGCFEDKIANVLLAGGEFSVIDVNSVGEILGPGDGVKAELIDDEVTRYQFGLEAVKNGFQKCFNGEAGEFARSAAVDFLTDIGSFDAEAADAVLQVILFGEVVYG